MNISTRFTVSRWSRTSGLAGSSAGQAHLWLCRRLCGLSYIHFLSTHSKPLVSHIRLGRQFCRPSPLVRLCEPFYVEFNRLHSKPLVSHIYAAHADLPAPAGAGGLLQCISTGPTVSRWAGLPYMCRPRRTAGSSAGRPPRVILMHHQQVEEQRLRLCSST